MKPRRATNATCLTMVWLSQWFDWQSALVAVQPETFQRWRRRGRQLFWRGTAYPGRPPIPVELQGLIWQMARDNITWGQRRIANELLLKLGLRVSENSGQVHAHRSRSSARPSRAVAALADLCTQSRTRVDRQMAAAWLARGVQAVFVGLMRTLQRWDDPSRAGCRGSTKVTRWPWSAT